MLTFTEAAKLIQNPLQRGAVEIFAQSSPVLERLPFMDIQGPALVYNVEKALPNVEFRPWDTTYAISTPLALDQRTERLHIMGGIAEIDRATVKTQGNINDIRAVQTAMKCKAVAALFTWCFFRGNEGAPTRGAEFDGLDVRLAGAQTLAPSAGGFTLADVDKVIDAVVGAPDVLFMNKATRRQVNNLMRAAGQAAEVISDAFGRMIPAYASIPIGVIDMDDKGAPILADGEIYACRFGPREYLCGIQAGTLDVLTDERQGAILSTLIEWIAGLCMFHPQAAARLTQ